MNAMGGGEGENHSRHYPLLQFIFLETVFIRTERSSPSTPIVVNHCTFAQS